MGARPGCSRKKAVHSSSQCWKPSGSVGGDELDAAAGAEAPGRAPGAAGGIGAGTLRLAVPVRVQHRNRGTRILSRRADAELIVTGEADSTKRRKVVGAIACGPPTRNSSDSVGRPGVAGQSRVAGRRTYGRIVHLSTPVRCGWRWPMRPIAHEAAASQVAARLGNSGPSGVPLRVGFPKQTPG